MALASDHGTWMRLGPNYTKYSILATGKYVSISL